MCGLFGVSGKPGYTLNLAKLTVLGLYNEARGKDSCGYYYNGNIERGIGVHSDFKDFVAIRKLKPGPLEAQIFLGHTRKGTHGANTLENAHPHIVDDNYVQTHNGVIKEIWPLCAKYGVSHQGISVDSIGLAHLIAKIGPKPILDEYKGDAALAFTYKEKPNALYLYHGKSKKTAHGEPETERPLFFLHQKEGVYYSSIKESLDAINDIPDMSPYIVKHNTVLEIVDGEFTDNPIAIDRLEANVPPIVHSLPAAKLLPRNPPQIARNHRGRTFWGEMDNDNDLILDESYPDLENDHVFFHQGKFFVYREFPLQNTACSSILNGEFIINRDGLLIDNKGPKDYLGLREHWYYFINGVMVNDKFDYEECRKKNITGILESTFIELSKKSVYPIIQIKDTTGIGKTRWYHRGFCVKKDTFTPKFSNKKYEIRKGATHKIIPLNWNN